MAKFSEWSPELEAALAQPFPRPWVKEKKQGGRAISFVSWHLYAYRLNELVGQHWSMGEPVLREVGGKLVMGLPITICGVSRINFGSEDEEHGNADEDGKVRDFGSAETNAFAQAFKRTCALFGLGLGLYDKDGVMAAYEAHKREREPERSPEHEQMLAWIRERGPQVFDGDTITVDRRTHNLKEYVREHWPTIKESAVSARIVVAAIEKALDIRFIDRDLPGAQP